MCSAWKKGLIPERHRGLALRSLKRYSQHHFQTMVLEQTLALLLDQKKTRRIGREQAAPPRSL
jgi:hypothetical protein